MDRRIYDMLDMYGRADHTALNNNTVQCKECFDPDYCLKTDYNDDKNGILTMAFVNMQPLDSVYGTDEGFPRGTIFPNIDKPWFGGRKK